MKIAVAQITCAVGEITSNVAKMRDFALRAKEAGSALIVFPEMVDTGYSMSVISAHAKRWDQGAVPELRAIAKALSIAIIAGVSEREDALIFNSQIFINAEGAIAGKYRKSHLFATAPIEEQKCFTAGTELASCILGDLRAGLSICYDLRFPEVYRTLAIAHEANVFIISSAWPFPRVEHFQTLAVARAIENQSYVIAANRVGSDDGVTFCGTSAIIDPYGVTIAAASTDREELLTAEISAQEVMSVRNRMPVFADRRNALYSPGK